jgi:hypothetical protein
MFKAISQNDFGPRLCDPAIEFLAIDPKVIRQSLGENARVNQVLYFYVKIFAHMLAFAAERAVLPGLSDCYYNSSA